MPAEDWVEPFAAAAGEVRRLLEDAGEAGMDPAAVAGHALSAIGAAARRERGDAGEAEAEVAAVLVAMGPSRRDRVELVLDAARLGTRDELFASPATRLRDAVGCGLAFEWRMGTRGGATVTYVDAPADAVEAVDAVLPAEIEDLARALAAIGDDEAAAVRRRLDEDASFGVALMVDPEGALSAYVGERDDA
jgi:hypothetical protein